MIDVSETCRKLILVMDIRLKAREKLSASSAIWYCQKFVALNYMHYFRDFVFINVRTTLLWAVTQGLVTISHRRFWTTYRSHLQESKIRVSMDIRWIFSTFVSRYICVIYRNMGMATVRTCEDWNEVGGTGRRVV
jgi:hypothetical protein